LYLKKWHPLECSKNAKFAVVGSPRDENRISLKIRQLAYILCVSSLPQNKKCHLAKKKNPIANYILALKILTIEVNFSQQDPLF